MPSKLFLSVKAVDSIETVGCETPLLHLRIANRKGQNYFWTSLPSYLRAMAFARAAAFRSCFQAARPAVSRPRLWQQVARRSYASGGHGSHQSGGDTMW